MKIFSSFLLLTGMGLCLLACDKDDDTPSGPNKTDTITSSAWVHESSGVDLTGDGGIDLPLSTSIPACLLDNALTFKKDGTGSADEGASKCNSTDPQTSAFNWSFADNETNLVISNYVFTALNGKFKIKTLSSTNLSVSKDTVTQLGAAQIIVNLKH